MGNQSPVLESKPSLISRIHTNITAVFLTYWDFLKDTARARTWEDFAISVTPIAITLSLFSYLFGIYLICKYGYFNAIPLAPIWLMLGTIFVLPVTLIPKHILNFPGGTVYYFFSLPRQNKGDVENRLRQYLAANPGVDIKKNPPNLPIGIKHFHRHAH
jgi:hypothetical protein